MGRPDYYGNPAGLTDDLEVVKAIYAAFAARDVEAALPFIADECELHLSGTAELAGRTEPYRGRDGVRRYFADAAAVWDEITLHADDYRALPGTVIVLGHVDLRRAGGERARRGVVWTWRLAGGRAVSVRVSDVGEFREP
jgi:ketosteroid isomerase-like protein